MTRTLASSGPMTVALGAAFLLVASVTRADDPPASGSPADGPPASWLDPQAEGTPQPPPVPSDPAAPHEGAPASDPSQATTPAPPRAVVHHSPVSSAPAAVDFVIDIVLDEPHLAKGVTLVHRIGKGPLIETPFARSEVGYRAVIPGATVRDSLGYAIELTTFDGRRVEAFATRGDLHPVQILPDAMDEHERSLLSSLGGRRSRTSVSGEYVDFGSTTTRRGAESDRYWGVEGRYTYRPLRTIAEFGFRGGVVRGQSPGTTPARGEQPEVGLNYGASSVRFRISDLWHVEVEGLASISEEGFSTGGGTQVLVGNPYGSKLVLGASFVGLSEKTYFGSRFYSRVDLAASERVTVSPTIEITDMPNADRYGVRLLAQVDVELGAGFSAQASGGYQARSAASGGAALGGGVTLEF